MFTYGCLQYSMITFQQDPHNTLWNLQLFCPFKKGFKTLLLKYPQCPSQIEVSTSFQSIRGSVIVFIIPTVSSIFQPHDQKKAALWI